MEQAGKGTEGWEKSGGYSGAMGPEETAGEQYTCAQQYLQQAERFMCHLR
jgi:hypothetical protein